MAKRVFDVVGSLVSMAVMSPVFIVIYLAIKIEDGGSAIYRQERIGRGGKPFTLYKFRSMSVDAESDGTPVLSIHEDNRTTSVGRFMRDHHQDELPQLWNVLRGDMSFVGPRPERRYFIDRIMEKNPRYSELYAVRPGLFSRATLYNGYTDTMEKMLVRLDMDLDYLGNHSFGGDMKIILLTAVTLLSGKKF